MSIRTQINDKKRKILIVAYSGMAFFIFGMILSHKSGALTFLSFVGFAVFFLSIVYAFWAIRCPRCRGNFSYVAMTSGSPFSVSKKIKYCPFCGVDIDTELNEQNQV